MSFDLAEQYAVLTQALAAKEADVHATCMANKELLEVLGQKEKENAKLTQELAELKRKAAASEQRIQELQERADTRAELSCLQEFKSIPFCQECTISSTSKRPT